MRLLVGLISGMRSPEKFSTFRVFEPNLQLLLSRELLRNLNLFKKVAHQNLSDYYLWKESEAKFLSSAQQVALSH